jgi:hypothetical protein
VPTSLEKIELISDSDSDSAYGTDEVTDDGAFDANVDSDSVSHTVSLFDAII